MPEHRHIQPVSMQVGEHTGKNRAADRNAYPAGPIRRMGSRLPDSPADTPRSEEQGIRGWVIDLMEKKAWDK